MQILRIRNEMPTEWTQPTASPISKQDKQARRFAAVPCRKRGLQAVVSVPPIRPSLYAAYK
jgi:hypothetical protein